METGEVRVCDDAEQVNVDPSPRGNRPASGGSWMTLFRSPRPSV